MEFVFAILDCTDYKRPCIVDETFSSEEDAKIYISTRRVEDYSDESENVDDMIADGLYEIVKVALPTATSIEKLRTAKSKADEALAKQKLIEEKATAIRAKAEADLAELYGRTSSPVPRVAAKAKSGSIPSKISKAKVAAKSKSKAKVHHARFSSDDEDEDGSL
jgi:hypothetical protein